MTYWDNIWEKKSAGNPSEEIGRYYRNIVEILLDFIKPVLGKKILEIGAGGKGEILKALREKGGTTYGIDISTNGLKRVKSSGIQHFLVRCDARKLPFRNESFEIVFSLGVVEHLPDRETVNSLREHVRVAKIGGITLVTVPNLFSLWNMYYFLKHIIQGTWKYRPFSYGKRYTHQRMEKMLQTAGLKEIKISGLALEWLFVLSKAFRMHLRPKSKALLTNRFFSSMILFKGIK